MEAPPAIPAPTELQPQDFEAYWQPKNGKANGRGASFVGKGKGKAPSRASRRARERTRPPPREKQNAARPLVALSGVVREVARRADEGAAGLEEF